MKNTILSLIFLSIFSLPALSNSPSVSRPRFGGDRPSVGYIPRFEGRSVISEEDIPSIWEMINDSMGKKKRPPRVRGNGGQPHGCVTGDTLITLKNGKYAYIKDLESGDLLLNQNKEVVGAHYTLKGKETKEMVLIETHSGKKIVATSGHPFFDHEGVLRADNFKEGGEILTVDGLEEVRAVEIVSYKGDVYNLAVAPQELLMDDKLEKRDPFLSLQSSEHTVVLNGFISGDIILQTLIEKK